MTPSKGSRQPQKKAPPQPAVKATAPPDPGNFGDLVGLKDPATGKNLVAPTSLKPKTPAQMGPGHGQTLQRQRILKLAGFAIVVDGIWGPRTQKAWRDYQRGVQPSKVPTISAQAQVAREVKAGNADKARAFAKENGKAIPESAQTPEEKRALAKRAREDALKERVADTKKLIDRSWEIRNDPTLARDMEWHRLSRMVATRESALYDYKDGKGSGIRAVQEWLDEHGYNVPLDGNYDKRTFNAIRKADADAEKKRDRLAVAKVKRLYSTFGWETGEASSAFTALGGRVPSPRLLATMMRQGGFTATLVGSQIAQAVDGGDIAAWNRAMNEQLMFKAEQNNPFGFMIREALNSYGVSESAKELTDSQLLMEALSQPATLAPHNKSGAGQEFQADQIRRAEMLAMANSNSKEDFDFKREKFLAVADKLSSDYYKKLSSEKAWWVKSLDALSKPGEYFFTGALVATTQIYSDTLGGGEEILWEDAQAMLGMAPETYEGDFRMTGPLLATAGTFIIDPLNFVAPVKFAQVGLRAGQSVKWGLSMRFGREGFGMVDSTLGHYKLMGRPDSFWQNAQVWNKVGPTLGKNVAWERGSWKMADAFRTLPGATQLADSVIGQKAQAFSDHFARLKNDSIDRAGRRVEIQMRNFFDGEGLVHGDTPKFQKVNSILRNRVGQAYKELDTMHSTLRILENSNKMFDELGDENVSLFLEDTSKTPTNVGASLETRFITEVEHQTLVRFSTKAAIDFLEESGYWGLREAFKSVRKSELQGKSDIHADLLALEKEAAAKFQHVYGSAESSHLGGSAADMELTRQIQEEVNKMRSQFRNTLMPYYQRRIKLQAERRGLTLFDEQGLWSGRTGNKVADSVRKYGLESFGSPQAIPNSGYGHQFTQLQMVERIRWELRNRLGRIDSYTERMHVGQYTGKFSDDLAVAAAKDREIQQVLDSWDEVSPGVFEDSRKEIMVSDLYARQYKVMRDNVEKLRTGKAWVGDWIASMAEVPQLAVNTFGEEWISKVAWGMGARWSRKGMRGVGSKKGPTSTPGYLAHIDNNISIRNFSPTDPQHGFGAARGGRGDAARSEGKLYEQDWEQFAGAVEELHRQQSLSADYIFGQEMLREGAWFQSAGKSQNAIIKYTHAKIVTMMRLWTFAALPLRMGWFVRNSVDNFIKALIAGAYDPRLWYAGAINPIESHAAKIRQSGTDLVEAVKLGEEYLSAGYNKVDSIFDGRITELLAVTKLLDNLHKTTVSDALTKLIDQTFWGQPEHVLKRVFDTYNVPIDEAVLREHRFRSFDKRVAESPLDTDVNPDFIVAAQVPTKAQAAATQKVESLSEQITTTKKRLDMLTKQGKADDADEIAALRLSREKLSKEYTEAKKVSDKLAKDRLEKLTPRQQRVYNETFHRDKNESIDSWYDDNSPLRRRIATITERWQQRKEVGERLDSIYGEINRLTVKKESKGWRDLADTVTETKFAWEQEWYALVTKVRAAEKVSDPADWPPAVKAALAKGDNALFSRLRGYTDEEIADFERMVQMAKEGQRRYGYSLDDLQDIEMAGPISKDIGKEYDALGLRLKQARGKRGRMNDKKHKMMEGNKTGEISPEIQKLMDDIVEQDVLIDKLKAVRAAIRENPELVDFDGQIRELRVEAGQLEIQLKGLENELRGAEFPPADTGLPYDEINKTARAAAVAAVRAMPQRQGWYTAMDSFYDNIWQIFGENPEAYFRRIIYRSEYVKRMKAHTAYIQSVETETSEMKARIEQEQMNLNAALGYYDDGVRVPGEIDVVTARRDETLRVVKEIEDAQKAKDVYQIHPFYVNPMDPSDIFISPVWGFALDEFDIRPAAGRHMGTDVRAFRSLYPERVAANMDTVRGYIVTLNGKVIDTRVTKFDWNQEMAAKAETVYPGGGSQDKEMRPKKGAQGVNLGPDFDLAPRNRKGQRYLDKGAKFEPVKRKTNDGIKITAEDIQKKVAANINLNFKDDPRFNPKEWSRPETRALGPNISRADQQVEIKRQEALEQAARVSTLKDEVDELSAQQSEIQQGIMALGPYTYLPVTQVEASTAVHLSERQWGNWISNLDAYVKRARRAADNLKKSINAEGPELVRIARNLDDLDKRISEIDDELQPYFDKTREYYENVRKGEDVTFKGAGDLTVYAQEQTIKGLETMARRGNPKAKRLLYLLQERDAIDRVRVAGRDAAIFGDTPQGYGADYQHRGYDRIDTGVNISVIRGSGHARGDEILLTGSVQQILVMADNIERFASDMRGYRELETSRAVLQSEAERAFDDAGQALLEKQGYIVRDETIEARTQARKAKYIQRLYHEFTDERLTLWEAELLLQNRLMADFEAKAEAIQATMRRRKKKLAEYYNLHDVKTKGHLAFEAHTAAWAKVEDTLFNYDNITNVEDNLRFFFPFIQFWRKNTAWWGRQMVEHPGIPAAIDKFEDEMDKWNDDVPQAMRRYIRISEVMKHMPDSLRNVLETTGLQDFAFDPINLTSFAPMWRLLKNENPLLRPEDAGTAFFADAVEFLQDTGLGFAPWAYKPMELSGWVNQRSWMTVIPQQSLLTAFTRQYYHDLDKRLQELNGWQTVVGYLTLGTKPDEIAANFEYWVNTEMVGQAERGEPISRERAESVMRDVFYLQQVSTYFGGVWLRRFNASDTNLLNMQEELRQGESDNFTDKEWQLIRLWNKRGMSRDKFDEYVTFLPQIEAYYRMSDFDSAEKLLQDNPQIGPYVRRKGTKPWSPMSESSLLNMQAKVDNNRFWNMANTIDDLDIDPETAFAITNTYVTPALAAWWEKNTTPAKQRVKMARAFQNAYYQDLNAQFFSIPDSDYAAKDAFIDSHPDIQQAWRRNNDDGDDFRMVWKSANAALRETWGDLMKKNGGDNWDEANAFLKQFPFMFEGTKSAGKVNPNTGEWKGMTAKGRAYRAAKPTMDWFFKQYVASVGEKEAFNWLFSNPDDARAKIILGYLKTYGKNSSKIVDLLRVWTHLRLYFSMDKKARGQWLEAGSPEALMVKAYFDKYGASNGQSQKAKDYLAVKSDLEYYDSLSKEDKKAWLASDDPRARAVLEFFKKYAKSSQQERAFKAMVEKHPWIDDSSPELRLRLKFWREYFTLDPDQREAYVANNAEAMGVFVYGNWGDEERHDMEMQYYRRAVGAGASDRMAAYFYVAPLLDFYGTLTDSFEKELFLRANPELKQYFEKYSELDLTGDPAANQQLDEYFNLPYGSEARRMYAQTHPDVTEWLRGQGSPADQAIYNTLDQYFSYPAGAKRKEYIAAHPELQAWFDRAKEEKSSRSAEFANFDKSDPRLQQYYDQSAGHVEATERVRKRLRQKVASARLSDELVSSRERNGVAPGRKV